MSDPRDVKALWQSQPQEIPPMVLERVRKDAMRSQAQGRWAALLNLVVALFMTAVFGLGALAPPGPIFVAMRVLGVCFCLWTAWRSLRILALPRPPDDAVASIAFQRRRLEDDRDWARRSATWAIGVVGVMGVLVVIGRWFGPLPPGRSLQADRWIIVVIGFFLFETLVLFWLIFDNRVARLQDRIAELDALGGPRP
jgi:hypothetical protein